MYSKSKSLLFLMGRCVAVTELTLSNRIRTSCGVLSGRCGFIQHPAWTSATRTVCLQRLCQLRSAVKTSSYSFCTKTGEPVQDEYPPLPDYESKSEPQPEKREVYIVQVKGLPWSCTEEDLLHFFSECRIRGGLKGIHVPLNRQGRSSGRAFIEMEHEEDVRKALEKHRQYIGPRYVEVCEVTNCEAEDILKNDIQAQANDGVVRLRGLPYTCNEDDIVRFFSGLDIVENGVTIVMDHLGRNSGRAFVQFSSQELADEALQRDRDVIGNRYIEVFPSKREEIHSGLRVRGSGLPQSSEQSADKWIVSQANLNTRSPQNPKALPLHCIHMRGLPFQASGEDIVQFFYPLVVSKILIEYGPNGKSRGKADIYFSCHQDTVAAMSRDKQYIGSMSLELTMSDILDELPVHHRANMNKHPRSYSLLQEADTLSYS